MAQFLAWFGSLIGFLYIFDNIWKIIEQPVIRLVTLGQIPGTEVFLNYENTLSIGLIILLLIWAIEHYFVKTKPLNLKQIDYIAI
jgi:hypothetical protein